MGQEEVKSEDAARPREDAAISREDAASGRREESGPGRGEGRGSSSRITIRRELDPPEAREKMAREVRAGLASRPREIPPKFFYDDRGSRLFQAITRLPEYYLTRAEREILEREAASLAAAAGAETVVEYGSGHGGKTELLLDAMAAGDGLAGYAPIDVSLASLREVTDRLAEIYPEARFVGILGDFETRIPLPFGDRRRLVLFLGSTIGNFTPEKGRAFLQRVGDEMADGDSFLVGFDLVKERETLERAYDDSAGVTAEFNRNVLRVLNRELGADFDPEAFRHEAVWNEEDARIEMYLVPGEAQRVRLESLDLDLELQPGERILTELSHKYTRDSVEGLLGEGDFVLERWETDGEGRFALALARPG